MQSELKMIKARGHEAYKTWLSEAGSCFSPISRSKERLMVGCWASWTVEGLYQGLKLIHVRDISLLDKLLEYKEAASVQPGQIIHFPQIMKVTTDLKRHPLFYLLKSGKKYNSKRNRCLGRTLAGERNWAFTDTWLDPSTGATLTSEEFSKQVNAPAIHAHLCQFPDEVKRLRHAWSKGEMRITDEMKQAHGHLRQVEKVVQDAIL